MAKSTMTPQQAVAKFLLEYILPDDQKIRIVAWASNYKRKHQSMSEERILRKTAERFNLKKVEFNAGEKGAL